MVAISHIYFTQHCYFNTEVLDSSKLQSQGAIHRSRAIPQLQLFPRINHLKRRPMVFQVPPDPWKHS